MPPAPASTVQQTTPEQPGYGQDALLAAAVANVLLTAITAAAAVESLRLLLRGAKLRAASMQAALGVVMAHPPGQDGYFGPASAAAARLNLIRRAQFTVAAARRIDADLTAARSQGRSQLRALADAVQRERRYYAQHLMAIWVRMQAGAQADSAAMQYGRLLGWHTVRDRRTSPECLAANGKNFYVEHMPVIGYPGAVHPNCRCRPGEPFPRGAILPSYGLQLRRAA